MSRISPWPQSSKARFPRVSGDEPRALSKVFIKEKFSPRERG